MGKVAAKQRGIVQKTAQLPFNVDSVVKHATEVNKNGLTNAGRALQKHIGRGDSAFKWIKFSHKTADQQAKQIINEVLNSKNSIKKTLENGTHEIYDTVTKRGFSVSREGKFNGFRTLDKVTE